MYSIDRAPTTLPEARRARPPVPWGWGNLALMLVVGVVTFFLLGRVALPLLRTPIEALAHALARQRLSPHVLGLVLGEVVLYASVAVALVTCVVLPRHASWAALGYRGTPAARLLLVVFVAYPATLVTAGLALTLTSRLLLHGHLVNPQVQAITGGVTRTGPNTLALLLLVAALAPIVEETVFRGVLHQLLRKSLPVWAASILSAAAFATAHLVGQSAIVVILPWLFVTGIALALVFEYCDSLFGSMLLHGLINGVNILVLLRTLPG